MKVYTADEIRRVEERENEIGTRFIRLMENAGSACAKQTMSFINERFSHIDDPVRLVKVCVVCGKGKNGGDGFVIARKLKENGYNVQVVLGLGAPVAPDAVEMYTKAVSAEVKMIRYDREQAGAQTAIENADVIVDCIFGIGFHGEPNPVCAEVFSLINRSKALVVAVDVPSGVNTDTGEVCRDCINADLTLAISTLKPAHVLVPARMACCKVKVLDIGISEAALASENPVITTIFGDDLCSVLPMRPYDCHKNDFGRVLCITGSRNMPGAACLCSSACVKSGAGLTTVAFPSSAYASLASHTVEAMLCPLDETEDGSLMLSEHNMQSLAELMTKSNVVAIGCGLGLSEATVEAVCEIIKRAKGTLVIDADAINAVSANKDVLKESEAEIIITPHPGEFERLTGVKPGSDFVSRYSAAKDFASEYGVTVLLKGASTIVVSKYGDLYINSSGSNALAKGGSGDVLTGIIAGLCAQGVGAFESACAGAFIHGKSAEIMSGKKGIASLCATDVIDGISYVYKEFSR